MKGKQGARLSSNYVKGQQFCPGPNHNFNIYLPRILLLVKALFVPIGWYSCSNQDTTIYPKCTVPSAAAAAAAKEHVASDLQTVS